MKIVMVDDSPRDRMLCRTLLQEKLGARLEFFEAGGASDGLETVRAVSPDCLLLDYALPEMSGLEFLSRLRETEPPAFAVVMLNGSPSEQVVVAALKAGAQDYLVKAQLTAEGLSRAIERATEKVGQVRALKAERDRLARSLMEKEVLLQEMHHRVKNNLQVIASLLRLQAGKFKDDEVLCALRDSQDRVESMALIHEQLSESAGLREVDFAKHVALLVANLFHSYGVDRDRIGCRVNVERLRLGVGQAVPACLILNELIANSLKHAFSNGKSYFISVDAHSRDRRIVLEVRDNGEGLPGGGVGRTSKSFGLEIVRILTRQLKGTFEMVPGEGTGFRVSFPRPPPRAT